MLMPAELFGKRNERRERKNREVKVPSNLLRLYQKLKIRLTSNANQNRQALGWLIAANYRGQGTVILQINTRDLSMRKEICPL